MVIFSSGNESKTKCGLQLDIPEELMMRDNRGAGMGMGMGMGMGAQNGCKADAMCGVGDGVNIGVRMELVD